jgi:short-subunit dehydrogenase
MRDLRGRTAVVTGASRGIGAYIARALARYGVNLALAARSAAELEAVAQEVEALGAVGAKAVAVKTDVTKEKDRKALVERAESELGPIDILVNNAGIEQIIRFSKQDPKVVRAIIETNLSAPLLLAREVLTGMIERERGHIVNIASLAGKKGEPFNAAYSATKAGLIAWTEAVSMELEGTGVSLSAICPGYVSDVGMFAAHGERAPRRAGESPPQKVAQAVVRAIREDRLEMIVNPGANRPLLALNSLSPRLGSSLLKWMGVFEMTRRIADETEEREAEVAREKRASKPRKRRTKVDAAG